MNEFWIGFIWGVATVYVISLLALIVIIRLFSEDEPPWMNHDEHS